ncbi:MAG: alpha/beta fold hydrolase [Gammaproteobacteria bacterium]
MTFTCSFYRAPRGVNAACTGILMLAALAASAAGPAPSLVIDISTPPGQLIDIGGYRLHLYCMGQGGPAVIFDSGLGGFSMDWIYVQLRVESALTACAYDRAGYGWSDPGPSPRASDQIAAELEVLLERAHVDPPYILVGHSFGAYNVRYFAGLHPEQVAGIVLVDGSHPDQAERLPELPVHASDDHRGTLITFFNPNMLHRYYPEDMWFPLSALLTSSKAVATQQRELRNFTISAAQVRHLGAFPPVPLIVVSRGQRVWPRDPMGDSLEKAWAEMQSDLAASTPGGRQIIARHSGHLIHLEEPDVVAEAIRSVVQEDCKLKVIAC